MAGYRMLAKQVGPNVFDGNETNCAPGSCPAVVKREDGKLVIVGKQLRGSSRDEFNQAGLVEIYGDEEAIVIDEGLLSKAFESLSK